MRIFLAVSLIAAFASRAGLALGSGNHHSAPMGGRSALMGGTGVALGVDGAAPFLNPATMAQIQGGKLAFSSRFYRFSKASFGDFYAPGPTGEVFGTSGLGNTDEVDHSLHSVPDSVCYFFPPLGGAARQHRLSLCLTTLEEQELSLTALGLSRTAGGVHLDENQHFDVSWSRFNVGPTWGTAVNEQLALGASLLVSFSRYKHALVGGSIIEAAAGTTTTSSYESLVSAASWDLATRLGATYALNKRFTLGASVTLPLVHMLGTIRQTHAADNNDGRSQWWGEGGFRASPPIEFRVGLGAEWQSVRLEADVFLTPGSSSYARGKLDREEIAMQAGAPVTRSASTLTVNERSHTSLNLALGAEVFVAERFSVLFGAQSDLNALDELDTSDARLFKTKLDYYRAGAGICSYTDYGDLMVGLRFDYGAGKAALANTLVTPSALGIASVREVGVMAVLAGSLSWRSIKQAANDIGDIVAGDGEPPPKAAPEPLSAPKRRD